jgi:hypothetical protein
MAITMKIAVFWDVNTVKSSINAKAFQRILLPLFSDWGLTLTPHPLLVPLVMKSRAISLLPLWVVRPVQSLSACTTVHFNFFLLSEQMKVRSKHQQDHMVSHPRRMQSSSTYILTPRIKTNVYSHVCDVMLNNVQSCCLHHWC